MTTLQIGTVRPPRESPAYNELTRRNGFGTSAITRWTGRSCSLVPEGKIFFQAEMADADRYTQAGCTSMGAQASRRGITISGPEAGSPIGTTFGDAWCCQQQQVLDVFEQYVASPEYKRRKTMGLVFAGAMVLGVLYLVVNREKFGWEKGGEHRLYSSWSANPGDTEAEESGLEEWR